jgi:hypothetical protein
MNGLSYLYRPRIGGLHEHERHGRPKKDDVRVFEIREVFAFQVPMVTRFLRQISFVASCPRHRWAILFPKRNDLLSLSSAFSIPS